MATPMPVSVAPDVAERALAIPKSVTITQTLAFANAVNGDDVRMGEPGGGLRLTGEPLADILLEGELRREHLNGYAALEPVIPGAVHHTHAAPPNLAFDRIGVSQGLRQTGGERLEA